MLPLTRFLISFPRVIYLAIPSNKQQHNGIEECFEEFIISFVSPSHASENLKL